MGTIAGSSCHLRFGKWVEVELGSLQWAQLLPPVVTLRVGKGVGVELAQRFPMSFKLRSIDVDNPGQGHV